MGFVVKLKDTIVHTSDNSAVPEDWKSNLRFDGSNSLLPVELFVQLMEQDVCRMELDDEAAFSHVCRHLSDVIVGWLRDEVKPVSWEVTKSHLVDVFGRQENLQLFERINLVKSLSRGRGESALHLLTRVRFVVNVIENAPNPLWVRVFLLLGLPAEDLRQLSWPESSETEIMELLNRKTSEEDSAEAFLKLQDHVKLETINWGNVAKSKTEADAPIKQEREALECCGIVFNNEDDAVNHYYDLQHGNVSKSVRRKRKRKLKTVRAKRSKKAEEFVETSDDETEENCLEKKRRNRSSRAVFLNSIKDISVEKSDKSIITQIVRDPSNGNKPMYVCAICKAIIPTRKAFSQHSRDEHNGMIAQCDLCHYQADNMQRMAGHRLSRHEKVTEGYGIIHCDRPGCGFRCVVNSELAFHVSSAHAKNLPPRICETCGKVFQTSGGLKMHKDIKHLGIRKYPCDQCDKRFTTDSHMRYHKAREHEKHLPSPFEVVCDECGKCYPRRNSLLQHIRSAHRQEKNNVCSYCGKAFFGSSQLRNHVKGVHQLDKTFVCPHCDRGMPNAYQLQIHVNCHLKKKLYHCRLCDSWYTAGYTLAFHIAVRHLGFSQVDGKKKENIDRARGHEAYEKVKDNETTSMALVPPAAARDQAAKRKFDFITEMKDNP